MFTERKSKMRNDVLHASFRSFVYIGDDDGGWCLTRLFGRQTPDSKITNYQSFFVKNSRLLQILILAIILQTTNTFCKCRQDLKIAGNVGGMIVFH